MKILQIIRRVHPETAFVKCMAVLLAYFFGSYVTGRFHQESGFIGAILACTSAIVVLQERDLKNSLHNAWLRVLGTFIGALIPDFVNVSPKNHLQIMGRYVDVVS